MYSFVEGVSVQDEPSLGNVETFLKCSSLNSEPQVKHQVP